MSETNNITEPAKIYRCPQCRKPVQWKAENTFRPFCSERCKLIDLGDWAAERHAISGSQEEDDFGDNF